MSVLICTVETEKQWWFVVWPSQYTWRNKLQCEHYDLCSIRSLYFRHNFLGLHIQDTENLCETYSGMQPLFVSLRQSIFTTLLSLSYPYIIKTYSQRICLSFIEEHIRSSPTLQMLSLLEYDSLYNNLCETFSELVYLQTVLLHTI